MIVKRNHANLDVTVRDPHYKYAVEIREPALGIIIAMTVEEALKLGDKIITTVSEIDPRKARDHADDIAERLEGIGNGPREG